MVAVAAMLLLFTKALAYRARAPVAVVRQRAAVSTCTLAAAATSSSSRWTRPLCHRLHATTFNGGDVSATPTDSGRFDDDDEDGGGDSSNGDDDNDEVDSDDADGEVAASPKEGSLRLKVRQHVNPLASTYQQVRARAAEGFLPSPTLTDTCAPTPPAAAATGPGLGAARLRHPGAAHGGRHWLRQRHLGAQVGPSDALEKRPRPGDTPTRGAGAPFGLPGNALCT